MPAALGETQRDSPESFRIGGEQTGMPQWLRADAAGILPD
jgi:hypothetical protein